VICSNSKIDNICFIIKLKTNFFLFPVPPFFFVSLFRPLLFLLPGWKFKKPPQNYTLDLGFKSGFPSFALRVWWGLGRGTVVATWRETWWFPPSTLTLSPSSMPMDSLPCQGCWSRSTKLTLATSWILILGELWHGGWQRTEPLAIEASITQICSSCLPLVPKAQSSGWTMNGSWRCGIGSKSLALTIGWRWPFRWSQRGSTGKWYRSVPGYERSVCKGSTNTISCPSSFLRCKSLEWERIYQMKFYIT